jgi:hypothetical protein
MKEFFTWNVFLYVIQTFLNLMKVIVPVEILMVIKRL